MSKESIGTTGNPVGSALYLASLNSGIMISPYLSGPDDYHYDHALEQIAAQCQAIISMILSDLEQYTAILRCIPMQERQDMVELVEQLDRICQLVPNSIDQAQECIGLLSLSSFVTMSKSWANDTDILNGVELLRNGSPNVPLLSGDDRVRILNDALTWDIESATGGDKEKRDYLNHLLSINSLDFWSDVLNRFYFEAQPNNYTGACGKKICSTEYRYSMIGAVFSIQHAIPSVHVHADWARTIQSELQNILSTICQDVEQGIRNDDYILDENGERLKAAVESLERCGSIGSFDLIYSIEHSCWYTPIDTDNILQLQRHLNTMGIASLKEDGVYGEKTSDAWHRFMDRLEYGVLPMLAFIDPTQTHITGVRYTTRGQYFRFVENSTDIPIFRIDKGMYHRKMNYLHLNAAAMPGTPAWHEPMIQKLDHMQLSPGVYDFLAKFDGIARKVRVAGRVMLVVGVVLDALELGTTVYEDLNDADRKLGKPTVSTIASIGGRWAGGIAGAKLGAMGGAVVGQALIPIPGVGAAVGGIVGGVTLGVIGSIAGDEFASWVVDITYVEDAIEQEG